MSTGHTDAESVSSRADLIHKVKDLESRLRLAEAASRHATPNHTTQSNEHNTPSVCTSVPEIINIADATLTSRVAERSSESDEEAAVDVRATRTFQDEAAGDVGYFGIFQCPTEKAI